MQHDGQEQQESGQQQAVEQAEAQHEPQSTPDSAQSQQQQTAEQAEIQQEPQSTPDSAQSQQQAAEQQAQMYLDQLQRTQADFMNYRRRMGQEQTENRISAQNALLTKLLPILDDLERALNAAPPELHNHPWVQGLLLVARRLTTQIEQLGVRQIGAPGERFDPHQHEAIMTEDRPDMPEGTILQVVRPGYALGPRIIRPAQVSVSSAPSSIDDTPV